MVRWSYSRDCWIDYNFKNPSIKKTRTIKASKAKNPYYKLYFDMAEKQGFNFSAPVVPDEQRSLEEARTALSGISSETEVLPAKIIEPVEPSQGMASTAVIVPDSVTIIPSELTSQDAGEWDFIDTPPEKPLDEEQIFALVEELQQETNPAKQLALKTQLALDSCDAAEMADLTEADYKQIRDTMRERMRSMFKDDKPPWEQARKRIRAIQETVKRAESIKEPSRKARFKSAMVIALTEQKKAVFDLSSQEIDLLQQSVLETI